MQGASLPDVSLAGADLEGANLKGASLNGANLESANLESAHLEDVDLKNAELAGARLSGSTWSASVPLVDHLDQRMAENVGPAGENLSMRNWHDPCGTTHCRAGWAIALAGERGAALERKEGSEAAGMMIYARSTGMVPDFHCSDADALADIKSRAAMAEEGAE